jgi:hypothetical protein
MLPRGSTANRFRSQLSGFQNYYPHRQIPVLFEFRTDQRSGLSNEALLRTGRDRKSRPTLAPSFFGIGGKEFINVKPVNKCIEPSVTRSVRIPQAEAVAAVLVKMEFDRLARFEPGVNNTKLSARNKIADTLWLAIDYMEEFGLSPHP